MVDADDLTVEDLDTLLASIASLPPGREPTPRCDVCGKFRRHSDVVLMTGEGSGYEPPESWLECRWCMSRFDRRHYGMPLPGETDLVLD